MDTKTKGALATLASAFLFGFTPVLVRLTYDGGSNSVMSALLRSALAMPLLFAILKLRRIPLAISRRNLRDVVLLGTFGTAATVLLINISLQYIPVGLTTVIHCTYPFFVVAFSALLFREKPARITILSLLMAMAGVALFADVQGRAQILGVGLAFLSALTFAFVMIFQYRSGLIHLPPLLLSFWLSVVVSVDLLVFSLLTGTFTLQLTPSAWLYALIVAIFVSVIAFSLLQWGLARIGSAPASILSMLEPIVSVMMGVLVLGESMTLLKAAGCALVLLAVTALTLAAGRPIPAEKQALNQSQTER